MDDMNDRTCIVSRKARPAEDLIRFVAGPDGMVVPDLKRKLPGRGCWVTADRAHVDKAAEKNLFARALKTSVTPPDNLGELVDVLLSKAAEICVFPFPAKRLVHAYIELDCSTHHSGMDCVR